MSLKFAAVLSLSASLLLTPQAFAAGSFPRTVLAVDLNKDGILDLATANFVSNNISILLGEGGGSFLPQVTFSVGVTPFTLSTGDLNNDGLIDIVVPNANSNDVSVLLFGVTP